MGRIVALLLLTSSLASCSSVYSIQGERIIAERDRRSRENIGQTRYFTDSGRPVCNTPDRRDCSPKHSGTATITNYVADNPKELPHYEVRLENGATAFMTVTDWTGLQDERERAEALAAKADCKRRGGVAVGMTAKQVLETCWGKPERVNETLTGTASHEQWVYKGFNYVYFRNGVVTSIQTHR